MVNNTPQLLIMVKVEMLQLLAMLLAVGRNIISWSEIGCTADDSSKTK